MDRRTYGILLIFLFASFSVCKAQQDSSRVASDIDFGKRKKVFATSLISGYVTLSTGLYFAWYKDYEQSAFHSFNDWEEWLQMDKYGHSYSAYSQTLVAHQVAKWSGYSQDQALHIAAATSLIGQLTIEVMDGFTDEWGFSYGDMAFNLIGTGLYYAQEKLWQQQPFKLKFSYWPSHYEPALRLRADDLFGTGTQKLLKDYNAQTYWLSMDLNHVFKDIAWPQWLDLAIGYGADNLYGGFENEWEVNGEILRLPSSDYKRTRQFYLALDYDLSEIQVRSGFLKTILGALNIFKWPAPAIEYNTDQGFIFHLVVTN